MAEVTPTFPDTYGGGSPLSSNLSSSPSSLLTQGSLRNQCVIPSSGDDDDIMLKPSGSDLLLSNGHMISVLAFSKDMYMNVSVPCDVSINYQQQPSFLPWSRLALLIYVLQGRSINFKTKEKKPEMKIEVADSSHSTNGDDESNNPCTTTTEEALICTCYNGIDDDDDDDSWSGFCLKCECSFDNSDMDYEYQLDEEESEEDEEYNEQNVQDDDDDDDFTVEFTCTSVSLSSSDPVISRMCLLAPPPPPLLQHVSSFLSDESGFCEHSNFDSSSNEEEEDEEERESACTFDEGFCHEFEEQACFSGTNSFFSPCPLSSPIDAINSDSGNEVILMKDINLPPDHLRDYEEDTVTDEESKDQTLQFSSCKRVRFKPEPHLFQVHHMVTWRHAYRMARKGHWEQVGLDRDRFQRRIETIGKAIGTCLLKKLEKMKLQGASNHDNDKPPVLVDVQ